MPFTHHRGETHDDKEVLSSTRRDLAQLAASLRQHLSYQAMVGLEWLPSELLPITQAHRETIDEIRVDLGDCIRCRLHSDRTHIVFGEGNPSAQIVLVGEGPGREEDRLGRPFVGPAGKLLDQMISAMGCRRQGVYICNVIKCRPPRNRDPLPDEIESCGPFLRSSEQPISRLRNHIYQFEGIPVVPTYHPAYLLRNPLQKRQAWKDVQLLLSLLRPGG
ncbi:MAG: uracil-DNA glycosylase [Deltaproteobacteria bacterium]